MRRLGLIGILLACAAVAALGLGAVAQGSNTYTFHVIFDDARGLIVGQTVKIAGAKAGEISTVTVVDGDKAEVTATIPGQFVFHSNASCIIRPDGLIAENYLNCDPGSASDPLLANNTVQPSHTKEPVSLLDLFNIFNVPTRERLQVLIDELGIATAGQGDNINAILERANPTLGLAQKVIGILDSQTGELATAIDATNTIAANGAADTGDVQAFLQRASALTSLTSNHASNLSQAIAKLPGLLQAAQPALAQLNTVASDGTPLLADIHESIPYLDRVDNDIQPFAKLAKPALVDLTGTINKAIPSIKKVTPLVKTINSYLKASTPTTATFSKLLVNLLQHGFSENFLQVVYYVSTALGHEDGAAHQLAALLMFPNGAACATYATSVVAGCQSHYGTQPAFTPDRRHAGNAVHHASTAATSASGASTSTTPTTGSLANLPSQLAGGINKVIGTVGGVTSGLNKALQGATNTVGALAGSAGTSTTSSSQPQPQSGLKNLLNFLFK